MKNSSILKSVIRKAARFIPGKYYCVLQYIYHHRRLPKSINNDSYALNDYLLFMRTNQHFRGYSKFVDKNLVQSYVIDKIGADIVVENHLISDNILDIVNNWARFPKRFIVKPTHLSGYYYIVDNKEVCDLSALLKEVSLWLTLHYYNLNREVFYVDLKPSYLVENLLVDEEQIFLIDYKFFCSRGDILFIQVDLGKNQERRRYIYDSDWEKIEVKYKYCNIGKVEAPTNFIRMKEIAERLSFDFDFVRVDLYSVAGKIYFSELTFCPGAGCMRFQPVMFDYIFGEKLRKRVNKFRDGRPSEEKLTGC